MSLSSSGFAQLVAQLTARSKVARTFFNRKALFWLNNSNWPGDLCVFVFDSAARTMNRFIALLGSDTRENLRYRYPGK